MRFDPQAGVTDLKETNIGRRRHGRLEQEAVRCSLGHVVELSASGMKIRCRKVRRDVVDVHIWGLGSELTVKGRIVWSKRIGFFKHEAGVQFLDMTPELVRKVTTMGMTNRDRRAIA